MEKVPDIAVSSSQSYAIQEDILVDMTRWPHGCPIEQPVHFRMVPRLRASLCDVQKSGVTHIWLPPPSQSVSKQVVPLQPCMLNNVCPGPGLDFSTCIEPSWCRTIC